MSNRKKNKIRLKLDDLGLTQSPTLAKSFNLSLSSSTGG